MIFQSNAPKTSVAWKLKSWHVLAFTGFFLALVMMMFPQQVLIKMLTQNSQPSLLSVTYLRNLARLSPQDVGLHVKLAEQELTLGELDNAAAAIRPYLTMKPDTALQWRIVALQYQITHDQTYALAENTPERLRGEAEQVKLLALLTQSPDLQADQAKQLAQQALALDQAGIAVIFYKRVIAMAPQQSKDFFAEAAKVALYASDYVSSGEFYILAMQNSDTLEQKRSYYIAAVNSIAAAGKPEITMSFAEKNLDGLADDTNTLIFLAEVAMSANQGAYAEKYIKQALNFKYITGQL